MAATTANAAGPAELYLSGIAPVGGTAIMRIDIATGADTLVAAVSLAGGGAANIHNGGLAYDPVKGTLYATGYDNNSSGSRLYSIDRATGVATEIGPTGANHILRSGGLAFDLHSRVLYATGEEYEPFDPKQASYLYTVDTTTGAATPLGYAARGTYLNGLAYDPLSGLLYAQGYREFNQHSSLFVVDKASGNETFIGENGIDIGRQLNYGGLAFEPVTHVLYAQGSVSASGCGLYTVNPVTGAATLVGTFATGNNSTDGGLTFVGGYVSSVPALAAAEPLLLPNRPNPFNPLTMIPFSLPRDGHVRLGIHDLRGRLLRTLVDESLDMGSYERPWDGRDAEGRSVGSGVYMVRLHHGNGLTACRTLTLLR